MGRGIRGDGVGRLWYMTVSPRHSKITSYACKRMALETNNQELLCNKYLFFPQIRDLPCAGAPGTVYQPSLALLPPRSPFGY